MARLAVFGYASLVSRASAAQTLARPVPRGPLARLVGWRRGWTTVRDNRAVEKTFALADSGVIPPHVLGLNVVPGGTPEQAPNGVLIEVSEAELERLDLREIRFRRTDVTRTVSYGAAAERDGEDVRFHRVFTYSARPENLALEAPAGAVIVAEYARTVERSFAELGPAQLRLYRETTVPPPVEPEELVLVRDRIPPGNPREW